MNYSLMLQLVSARSERLKAAASYHRFVEGQPRLRAIPANEIIDGSSITAL